MTKKITISIMLFNICLLAIGISKGYEENIIGKINIHLEEIEDIMKTDNLDKLCHPLDRASNLINDNLESIKKIEPYYRWEQINLVIDDLMKANCNAQK
tara:strand:- start:1875 stop:2171 length:297 start_codon:yes stop_codon:yes gene_type:complete